MTPTASPGPRAAFTAVVPAAGLGVRMGSRKPLLAIDGVPILFHTLRRLRMASGCAEVVLAAHPEDLDEIRSRKDELGLTHIVEGGRNRQESVLNALRATNEAIPLVLIHDAVRPLVHVAVIEAVAGRIAGPSSPVRAAIAASPAVATIKEVGEDGMILSTPDRDRLWMAQTPQGFTRELALRAHERAAGDGFLGTDDAQLVERLGEPVAMVEDTPDNIKITVLEDLALAAAILAHQREQGLPEAQ